MNFEFPDYYKWPFFFTIQKHTETKLKQLNMWVEIIKNYCKHNKKWRITTNFLIENICINKDINRFLNMDNLKIIIGYMIKNNLLIEISKDEYLILWKSIEDWENIFYDSVIKHHRIDSLETIEYLMNDEEIEKEEFFGIDKDLLIIILRSLENKKKCILIKENNSYIGVKFLKI